MNTHMHAKHAYIHTCLKHAYTHTRSKHAYTHTHSKHAYMHTHLHIHMKMEKEKSHPIIFFGLNPPKLHLKGWGHPMAEKALHALYGPTSNAAPLSPTPRFFSAHSQFFDSVIPADTCTACHSPSTSSSHLRTLLLLFPLQRVILLTSFHLLYKHQVNEALPDHIHCLWSVCA